MTAAEQKEALRIWKEHCISVQNQTTVNRTETRTQQLARIERARKDYDFFVEYYFPHYCTDKDTGIVIPNAKFHNKAANKLKDNKDIQAAFIWARGHAKSTHVDIMIPLWLKCQKVRELNVMVLVGKSQDAANTLLSDVQAELQYNQRYINDFGKQFSAGSWTAGEFVTADDCAFFARGRGQSPRGLRYKENRPDYIAIDDLDDDELVENEARVKNMVDWVKEALFGAFGPKGGRFVNFNSIGFN